MNKKAYQKPAMQVVKIQHKCNILSGSPVTGLGTNLTDDDAINYGGGNSGTARSRSFGDWDDEE